MTMPDIDYCVSCGLPVLSTDEVCHCPGAASAIPSTALLAAAKDAMDILGEAPEINPCNYTHEEACEINAACTNAYQVLMDAIAAANTRIADTGGANAIKANVKDEGQHEA